MVAKSHTRVKNSIKVPGFEVQAGFTTTNQRSKIMSKIAKSGLSGSRKRIKAFGSQRSNGICNVIGL